MENIEWLKDVIYLIPVAGLIWKASAMSSKVKSNEDKIKEIRTITDRQNEAILASLDKMNTVMTEIQQDVAVLKALRGKDEKPEV